MRRASSKAALLPSSIIHCIVLVESAMSRKTMRLTYLIVKSHEKEEICALVDF